MCSRCVLCENPPDIVLDADDVCNLCREHDARPPEPTDDFLESDFTRLIAQHRGKQKYDCLVMCSGGKDSTASLYYTVRRYKLTPLVFTFDNGFETQDALDNVHRAVDKLGVDFLFFRSSFMKDMFARAIKTNARVVLCHLCSIWYMQTSFDVAARYDIPLIIAGWTKGQSTKQGVMSKCACNAGSPAHAAMSQATRTFLATLEGDPKYGDFPRSMEECLERAKKRHRAIVVSPHWFLQSHPEEYVEVLQRELGWQYPKVSYPAKSTNCNLNFVSMQISFKHYGYTHYHVEMSRLIRENLMTRDEALEALRFDYPQSFLDGIASQLGCTVSDVPRARE